jgi:hypothetical protein
MAKKISKISKKKCDCHLYTNLVCDICQGIKNGKMGKDTDSSVYDFDRIFGLEVSLALFESKSKKNITKSAWIRHLNLSSIRGGADMSEESHAPKMHIAVCASPDEVRQKGILPALNALQKELNHNIDRLKEVFIEKNK